MAYSEHLAYIAFGAARGQMRGRLMDVHGAGAQRSDPKSGNAGDYPQSFGPQGDLRYVFNFVWCVRSVGEVNGKGGWPAGAPQGRAGFW